MKLIGPYFICMNNGLKYRDNIMMISWKCPWYHDRILAHDNSSTGPPQPQTRDWTLPPPPPWVRREVPYIVSSDIIYLTVWRDNHAYLTPMPLAFPLCCHFLYVNEHFPSNWWRQCQGNNLHFASPWRFEYEYE